LNLKIYVDKYGRSPLHYAAKHGQSLLLQHFIGMTGNTLNLRDQSGETEMDYAVLSGEIECVKVKAKSSGHDSIELG
jgi:ankyrin repeat protein